MSEHGAICRFGVSCLREGVGRRGRGGWSCDEQRSLRDLVRCNKKGESHCAS